MRPQPAPPLPASGAPPTPDLQAELTAVRAELAAAKAELAHTRTEAQKLHELLDLARGFGRLGVWERDVDGLNGRWDDQCYAIYGMAPQPGAPPLDDLMAHIAAADRDALGLYFRDSMRQAGHYSFRYRTRQADGTLRRVQSQWVVKNGADGQPARMLGLLMDDSEPFRLARSASDAESQLALAVDLGGIAIWRHDLKTQRMHYNEQAWRVLDIPPRPDGLSIDEVRALIHPDDLAQVLDSARAALATDRPTDMEARYRRSDGSWRDVLTRRVVQRDNNGHALAFVGVAMDVTERVEQTRRAAGVMRRFELVTRTAGIGHWSVQGRRAQAQWSDTLHALFGLPTTAPPPPVEHWVEQFVHPADRAAVEQAFAAWMASERDSVELGFRIVRPDGSERQLVSHTRREAAGPGSHGGDGPLLYGVVIDITERHSAERALRSAAERAALAARAVGLGTWEMNLENGNTIWDEQMWRLRGVEPRPGAMTADERLACVHPDDREHVRSNVYRLTRQPIALAQEFRVLWPNGEVHWLSSRSMPVLADDGRLQRRIGVTWDVTAQRTADAARQDSELARRESAAKSRFLARMSHELRTPLNAVLGFTQLLLADAAAVGPQRRRLEHIHAAGRHLLALINDVLDLSSLQSGELRIACRPVALAPLVAQTLPLLGPAGDGGGAVARLHTGALDVQVMADPTRLRQVLLNLLTNALKYNRPGGQVHVEAAADGDWVSLRIADNGHGMDEAQLKQLFEPFNRLGREAQAIEGTGIGLAIVKALVEGMGGSVTVRSRPGQGTCFEVRLAAAGAAAQAGSSEPTSGPVPLAEPAPGRQILYIEDNPVNALIVSQLLQRRGDLALTVAEDGARGVALAAELRPDLILLDMQLPDFDGIEVMRRLRADANTARIPCIALSANAMPEDIDAALRAGAADYWTKPLEFKAFLKALDALFGKAPV